MFFVVFLSRKGSVKCKSDSRWRWFLGVGLVDEARQILKFLHREISPDTYVNIMEQYRPTFKVRICRNDGFGLRNILGLVETVLIRSFSLFDTQLWTAIKVVVGYISTLGYSDYCIMFLRKWKGPLDYRCEKKFKSLFIKYLKFSKFWAVSCDLALMVLKSAYMTLKKPRLDREFSYKKAENFIISKSLIRTQKSAHRKVIDPWSVEKWKFSPFYSIRQKHAGVLFLILFTICTVWMPLCKKIK